MLLHVPYKFSWWPDTSVNINHAVEYHVDKSDDKEGICCVIIFGDFTGGELCFPDAQVYVNTTNGAIILFHSAKYHHVVAKFKGVRNSIVLFCPAIVLKHYMY